MKLLEIVNDANEELLGWLENNPDEEPHDIIWEIADTSTPIYYADIMQIGRDNLGIATNAVETPAFDGKQTATNVMAAAIYAHIEAELWDTYHAWEEEQEDTWEEDQDRILERS